MAGYSRQSAASIVPTAVVRATPLNDEFNTLRDAFVVATGHKHDGTSTEGAYVPLISDTNSRNKVVVDSANNRISLFINVSSAAVEQLRLIDGAILPVTDNDIDLGSSSFEFKDLFIDGTANIDSLVADTAAISGGTINSAVIGGTTPAAGTFTTVSATVSATIPSATISGGTINNTTIGATTPAAGTFTNLTVNTAATIASAAISAGTINNTVIGGTTPQAVTGTTITANTGFVGALTGNVTGNVTASSGTSTFNNATVNGTLSATLTGNVNASSGTSTFNNVTISGTLNMDGATAATITNLSSPVNNSDAATKGYVDTAISNLIDTAPGTLDTLNELAAALGDDPNFATTVTNSIATKLSLSGGTMTGAIAMGTNKITGMGDPTNAQDAATKTYVDTQRDTRLALSGGTMSGAIAMGTNKITGLGDPTSNQDAATKIYVDGILGSATSAAASAAAAATSASNAATSASNASTSATNAASSASAAAASAAAAAASYDSFDDRYLGVKTSDPSLDNDGNALVTGAIYFNSTAGEMRVWTGSAWASTLLTTGAQTFTGVKTFASNPILDAGTANGVAYLNGSKVLTTGSALTFDGTNLGIGATTPLQLLHLSSASPPGMQLTYQGVGASRIGIAAGNALTFGLDTSNGATEQMRLTSTGLGIGTSSPAAKLQVNQTLSSGTAISVVGSSANTVLTSDYASLFLQNTNTTNGNYNAIGFVNDQGGYSSAIYGVYTSHTSGAQSGELAFSTRSAGTFTERMRLDSSGNLGIGTSSPAQKLEVNGSAYLGGRGSTFAFMTPDWRMYNSSSGNALVWDDYSTERMRLNSSGNLGIGTSSPTARLTVVTSVNNEGVIRVSDNATYYGELSRVNATDEVRLGSYGPSQNLTFYTVSSERMRLDSSGNLGLGVTPSAWNSVLKAIAVGRAGSNIYGQTNSNLTGVTANAIFDASDWKYVTSDNASRYQQNSGVHSWYTAPSGTAGNTISFTQAMTLDSSGNLGIGTSSPTGIFNIKTSNGQFLVQNGTSANQMRISAFNNAGNANAALIFEGYSSEYGRFDSSGNLGLGVTPTSGWRSGDRNMQIGPVMSLTSDTNVTSDVGYNYYYNTSNFPVYLTNAQASRYSQYQGAHRWFTAGSGTAGTTFSFTQAMTLDASGNLGVGTTSPLARLDVVSATSNRSRIRSSDANEAVLLFQNSNTGTNTADGLYLGIVGAADAYLWNYENNPIIFGTNNTERARITSTGDVGIGTSSPGARLNAVVSYVASTIVPSLKLSTVGGYNTDSGTAIDFGQDQGNYPTWVTGRVASPRTGSNWGGSLTFSTNDDSSATALVERARITSGGYFKASNDGTYASPTGALHELKGNPDDNVLRVQNYQATLTGAIGGVRIIYSAASPNTTSRSFLYCDDSTALRAEIRSNGGIANYQANDVNLSDQRLKTDVQPSGSYLDKICAIPVKTFLYKDQTDTERNLGVMAQDVDAVAPELIDHSGFGEAPEGESPYLAVYQTDLQYALMKCIQELKAQNDDLRARVAQLEAK